MGILPLNIIAVVCLLMISEQSTADIPLLNEAICNVLLDSSKSPIINNITPVVMNNKSFIHNDYFPVDKNLLHSTSDSKYPSILVDIPMIQGRTNKLSFDSFQNFQHLLDGSNSNIFRATLNSKEVIIKVIKSNQINEQVANREFATEHEILLRLSHSNVIEYYGKGTTTENNSKLFLVFDYYGGNNLNTVLKSRTLSRRRVLEFCKELATALAFLHEEFHPDISIIHRDLKPDNIVFTNKGVLKLIDFGLSACVNRHTTMTGTYAMTGGTGSMRYMAPEVMKTEPYNERIDIYSFAILLWQCLTQTTPYSGYTKSELYQNVVIDQIRPSLDDLVTGINTGKLKEILNLCWNGNWNIRPIASEVSSVLTLLLEEEPQPQPLCCFYCFS